MESLMGSSPRCVLRKLVRPCLLSPPGGTCGARPSWTDLL